jgi:hypothetical protein
MSLEFLQRARRVANFDFGDVMMPMMFNAFPPTPGAVYKRSLSRAGGRQTLDEGVGVEKGDGHGIGSKDPESIRRRDAKREWRDGTGRGGMRWEERLPQYEHGDATRD